jgi:hypothetical protein
VEGVLRLNPEAEPDKKNAKTDMSAAEEADAFISTSLDVAAPEELDELEREVAAFIGELRSRLTDPRAHHERMLLTALYTEALLQRAERPSSMQLVAQLTRAFTRGIPEHVIDPADLGPPSETAAAALAAAPVLMEEVEALALLPRREESVVLGLSDDNFGDPGAGSAFEREPSSPRHEESLSESGHSSATDDSLEMEVRKELELLTREQKLNRLLKWIRSKAMPLRYSWREMQEEHDPRLKSVDLAIGVLYEDYFPDVWFWKLYEVSNKLAITGALSFIAPGSTTQIVAGLGIAFFSLLVYLRFLPYPKKTIRQLAYCCNLVVFLFFFIALLLRFDTTRSLINGDKGQTNFFYSAFVIGLWVSIPLTLVYVSIASGDLDTILLTWHGEEEEEEEED